jgi:endonuclease/exonuclease/phosphatase (EEP) superfamily protein YafD
MLYWNVGGMEPQTITKEVGRLVDAEDIDVACLHEVPYPERQSHAWAMAHTLDMDVLAAQTRILASFTRDYRSYGTAILVKSDMVDGMIEPLRPRGFRSRGGNRASLVWVQTQLRPSLIIAAAQLTVPRPLGLNQRSRDWERRSVQRVLGGLDTRTDVLFGGDVHAAPGSRLEKTLGELGLRALPDVASPPARQHASPTRVFASGNLAAEAATCEPRVLGRTPLVVTVE